MIIDSLEIDMQAKSDSASKSLDNLVKKLGLVAEGISAIGKNNGLEEFVKKAQEATKGFENIQNVGKTISANIEPQMQKITKSLEQITAKYKDLGKGFTFTGTDTAIQKQIDKYTNALENAQLKKQELELSGKTEGQAYEDAVKNVLKYTNVIESLKTQLGSIQTPYIDLSKFNEEEFTNWLKNLPSMAQQASQDINASFSQIEIPKIEPIDIGGLNYNASAMEAVFGEAAAQIQNYADAVKQFGQQAGEALNAGAKTDLSQMSGRELDEWFNNLPSIKAQAVQAVQDISNSLNQLEQPRKINISAEDLNYNAKTMETVFGEAAGSIENWQQAVEQLGERAGRVFNESTQLNINTSGLEEAGQNLDSLSGQLQNMKNLFAQTFADLKSGDIFRYLSESAQNFTKKAQLAAGVKVYTEDYKTLQGDIERSEKALEKLQQKQRDLEAAGTSTESTEWQKVAAQITAAESRLDSYINRRNEMESSGADVEFSGGLANQSIIKNIGVVAGEAMASLRQKISEVGGAVSQSVGNIPIIGRVAKEAAFLGKAAFEGFKFALSGVTKAANAAVSAVSKITSVIAKLVSGVNGAISKLSSMTKSFIGIKSASKGMNASLGGGLKVILKYALGIRSFYMLINKLRAAMKEGFKNLAQYSDEVNHSISTLKSSLGALKNSLATAFAPILNVIAPALSAFIDMLTKAFNTIGQFFAALTGKAFAAQAKKNFTDYAAGLSKTGDAEKKAEEDIQKGARAFDELNIITTNKKDNSSGDSSSGEVSPADMFETVPIENSVSDFAQKLKNAWANADFTEIGTILGTKLKTALDNINWEPIKETAAQIGSSIGTLINGFVKVDGLANSIGRTIGEAINTGIIGINNFLDSTQWNSVGVFIGEGLNSVVDTIDWEGAGHLFAAKYNAIFEVLGNAAITFDWSNFGLQLATGVNTFIADFDWAENGARLGELAKELLDSIITFLENTDWQALGNGIADFIGGIDWGGILERLAEGIGAALGGLAALLWGLIEDAWNSVVEWWNETAFEDGQFTMSGLLNGIWEGIKNIGSWIVEHIFEPFIDGFRKAFGIASPSKVMEEQGNFIMEGLLNGIASLVDKVTETWENMKAVAIETWENVKTSLSEKWESIKEDASSKFDTIKSNVSEAWENLKSDTSDKWSTIQSDLSDVWSETKENASDTFGIIKDSVTEAWNELKKNTSNVWNQIKDVIKNPINSILGFINKLTGGIETGVNGMINALNGVSFDIPDWIPSIGGKTFGFNIPNISIPQIPSFATGGIVYKATFLEAGEAGAEAILPLTNKRTMGMIADSIIENIDYGSYGMSGNNNAMIGSMERVIYQATYNAVLSAINNSKTMNEMLDEVKTGHTIEMDGSLVAKTVRKEAVSYFNRTGKSYFPV